MELIDILKGIHIFGKLSEENLADIAKDFPNRISGYKQGDIVAFQGQEVKSLIVLLKGTAKAHMENKNMKRLTVDSFIAPSILAPAFLYSSENRFPVTVEISSSNAEFLFLNKDYFSKLMTKEPSVMKAFIREISDRSLFLSKRLNSLGLEDLRNRIINYLKGNKVHETQEEMAMSLAVARPSLARVLGELIEEGVIIKEGKNYKLSK